MTRVNDALLKLIGALIVVLGLYHLLGGTAEAEGFWGVIWASAVGLFEVATGLAFMRFRGWAFLVVSVGLLVGWLLNFVAMVVAWDQGLPMTGPVVGLLVNTALIGYLGRWSMEKRFRPHLDIDH